MEYPKLDILVWPLYNKGNVWNLTVGAIHDNHIYLQGYFLYQLNSIAIVASIITTVVLALERFLAVSKPIEYHNATLGINPWRRVMNYIFPVIVFSIIFNIPKFFEAEVKPYEDQMTPEEMCW